MDDGAGEDRLSFLGRPLPPGFELRLVVLPPGCELPFDEADWRDALVVVERGELELECIGGSRLWIACGDVFWLRRLGLRAVRQCGGEPAVLVGVSRRGP